MITLQSVSEIVCGLVISNKLSSSAVRTELLFPPYDEVVKLYKSGITETEALIERVDLGPVQASLEAVKSLNGLSGSDWLSILDNTYMKYNMGIRLEKLGKKMQRGDDVDVAEVRHVANQFGKGKTGRTKLSEVQSVELPFILTGWKALDTHLMGIPEAGLIVIGGDSGVGKTTFMRDLSKSFVRTHPDKKAAIYSLEMFLPEIATRYREPKGMPKELEERIEINCDPLSMEEVVSDASEIDNLGLVMIDFADMMIKGEISEGKMSEIYLTAHYAAKQLHVPIVLFCQFSKAYQGGLPRPAHIRWTAMAEKLAWMILMLYRPAEDYHAEEDDAKLPVISDIGYIIAWKIRGGFRAHKDDSPGAIQLPFDGEKGWSKGEGKWFSLRKA